MQQEHYHSIPTQIPQGSAFAFSFLSSFWPLSFLHLLFILLTAIEEVNHY